VTRLASMFLLAAFCSACFDPDGGEDRLWASREQIIEAAERCGVHGLEPTRAGVHWAAYVPGEKPRSGPKGDCIYNDLRSRGLQATR